MAASTDPNMQRIIEAGQDAYKCLSRFNARRFKILKHCNLVVAGFIEHSPPSTRTQEIYTVKLGSTCHACHNRHVSLGRKAFLLYYASLPFKCEHGLRVEGLQVDDPDERLLPLISLPPGIRKIAPDTLSESSEGQVTQDKLDRDLQRLQVLI